jgi:hypothetical protein
MRMSDTHLHSSYSLSVSMLTHPCRRKHAHAQRAQAAASRDEEILTSMHIGWLARRVGRVTLCLLTIAFLVFIFAFNSPSSFDSIHPPLPIYEPTPALSMSAHVEFTPPRNPLPHRPSKRSFRAPTQFLTSASSSSLISSRRSRAAPSYPGR